VKDLLFCLSGHDVRAPAKNIVLLPAGFVYTTKYSNFAGIYCLVKLIINALCNLEDPNKHCRVVHCLKKSEYNSFRERGQGGATLHSCFRSLLGWHFSKLIYCAPGKFRFKVNKQINMVHKFYNNVLNVKLLSDRLPKSSITSSDLRNSS
jgi:hypothetical protein